MSSHYNEFYLAITNYWLYGRSFGITFLQIFLGSVFLFVSSPPIHDGTTMAQVFFWILGLTGVDEPY